MSRIIGAIALLLALSGCSSPCQDCERARNEMWELNADVAKELPKGDGCDDWRRIARILAAPLLEPSAQHRERLDDLAKVFAEINGTTAKYELARMRERSMEWLALVEAAMYEACS